MGVALKGRRPDPFPAGLLAGYTRLLTENDKGPTPLLTEAGVAYLHRLVLAAGDGHPALRNVEIGPALPSWDEDRQELWLGGVRLKELRHAAPGQATVLAAFQTIGWARGYVDDPLLHEDGETESEARQRLRDTVKNLNRGLPARTIHFRVRGTRVSWEYARGGRAESGQ